MSTFGYCVDSVSAKTVLWVADELSVDVRNTNPSHIKLQTIDYSTMFHAAIMARKEGGTIAPEIKSILAGYTETDRSSERSTMTRLLMTDISAYSFQYISVHTLTTLQTAARLFSMSSRCPGGRIC